MARPSAQARGYGGAWQKARAGFLRSHPWCVMCTAQGRRTTASHVDHIKPHKGDQTLFWTPSNWQGLCAWHHNREKQQIERRGYSSELDISGLPVDPNHPANRGSR
jgi:5-methylcytosine-specific restriction enzyme A